VVISILLEGYFILFKNKSLLFLGWYSKLKKIVENKQNRAKEAGVNANRD